MAIRLQRGATYRAVGGACLLFLASWFVACGNEEPPATTEQRAHVVLRLADVPQVRMRFWEDGTAAVAWTDADDSISMSGPWILADPSTSFGRGSFLGIVIERIAWSLSADVGETQLDRALTLPFKLARDWGPNPMQRSMPLAGAVDRVPEPLRTLRAKEAQWLVDDIVFRLAAR